jgi:AdoMet-dependent heme synthase
VTRRPDYLSIDFDVNPVTVAWEVTRACALACRHCRAEAIPRRDPRELTTAEACGVVDQVVELGPMILVITGGDPLMRPDLFDIAKYASARGLRVALSPSATALLRPDALERARDAGVQMIHLSIDGATARTHDAFRGVDGSFDRTLSALVAARDLGMPVQIGTTVTRTTVDELEAVAALAADHGATMWSLFFVVPTGRAIPEFMLNADETEQVLEWLAELSESAPFQVRTTAAQHYRRVMIQHLQRKQGDRRSDVQVAGAGYAFASGRVQAQAGVNDGKGFCFISHVGDVYPSGFLQASAGNVRSQSLASIYRDAPMFRELRDPLLLRGKCGACSFKQVCGGSRARAYAITGDYLAADPACAWDERPAG